MEHNLEKNIRMKVRQAEQYPIRWQKEELWARMEVHRTTRSKRPVYFSIAASLTLAVLAGIYIYQQTGIPTTPIKTVNTESAPPGPANQLLSPGKDIPATKDIASGKAIAQNAARIRIEEEPYISTAIPTTNDTLSVPGTTPLIDNPVTIPESIQTEVATEIPVNRPKVIIGIIPQQEQPLLTQQEKRKKSRLLKGKSGNGNTEGNQLIIARIN
jgi:hypothetical protein